MKNRTTYEELRKRMLDVLGITEIQAERKRRQIAEETGLGEKFKAAISKFLVPAMPVQTDNVDKSFKHFASLKVLLRERSGSSDYSNKLNPFTKHLEKDHQEPSISPIEEVKEAKVASEDRIKMPSTSEQTAFYKSIVRPITPAKIISDPKNEVKKLPSPKTTPIPPGKRNSFDKTKQEHELLRRHTVGPVKRQSVLRVKEKTEEIIEETFEDFPVVPSEENRKYVQKIKALQKSKKRCAAESELLKTYQRLINYVP